MCRNDRLGGNKMKKVLAVVFTILLLSIVGVQAAMPRMGISNAESKPAQAAELTEAELEDRSIHLLLF